MDAQSVSMEAESVVTSTEVGSAAMKPEDAALMEAESATMVDRYISMHHQHAPQIHQCSSILVKHINAPVNLVWSLVRKFNEPQIYKPFVEECMAESQFRVGSIRRVLLRTGLPATNSTEMLERLDDEQHILGIKILGGDHILKNYSSVVTVHKEEIDGREGSVVIESFIVDVPERNTHEQTCYFVMALLKWKLCSLMLVSQRMAREQAAAGVLLPPVVNGP